MDVPLELEPVVLQKLEPLKEDLPKIMEKIPDFAAEPDFVAEPCYQKTWTCDDSGNVRLDGDGVTVRHGGAEGPEKKGNAMWTFSELYQGSAIWEFKVLGSGGFWLGVTTKDKFGPGYGMKGLFFGGPGNLSDGGSLVAGGWGPRMEEGDVIGMRLTQEGGNVTLAFSKNGKGLGTAFDIQGWDEGALVPAVSLEKPGQGVTLDESMLYASIDMDRKVELRTGIEGKWKLDRPGVQDHVFEIIKDPAGRWMVNCVVANSMSCALEGDGLDFKASGGVRSTMMMPPPELEELEREMGALMEGITRIVFDFSPDSNGPTIVVTSGGNTFRFNEFFEDKKPAGKEKINWKNK